MEQDFSPEVTKEIGEALNAVLEKYNAEIRIVSRMHILPKQHGNTEETRKEPDSETTESSSSDSTESTK